MKQLTLGSIFDGSGGFPLGAVLHGITPAWASEIEPFPIRVTSKRFPQMKHYGDITKLNGGVIEPVDIITFGSPCTDMSVAGKRAGLSGKQSRLFYEAIRVIKEMREATNGEYPRFICFENVQGAFTSNRGADFKAILDAIVGIVEPGAEVPTAHKVGWPYADILVGDGWSIAYRLIDAQYFSVPQRRKRIYLVADFGSECAGEILFERQGVSRDFTSGSPPWKSIAGDIAGDTGAAIHTLNDQGGSRMVASENVSATLRAQVHGHQPIVAVHQNQVGKLRVGEVANTLSTNGNASGRNAPLIAAFMAGQGAKAGSIAYSEGVAPTLKGAPSGLNQSPCAMVAYSLDKAAFHQGENALYDISIREKRVHPLVASGPSAVACDCRNHTAGPISATLQAKNNGGQSLNYINPVLSGYIVRRLTPRECASLQGFPRDWCAGLETPEPSEDEVLYWAGVWETHRRIIGKSTRQKTRNQIMKWLRQPYSDSAEFRMWGNGVALPCVCFVMAGIREVMESET